MDCAIVLMIGCAAAVAPSPTRCTARAKVLLDHRGRPVACGLSGTRIADDDGPFLHPFGRFKGFGRDRAAAAGLDARPGRDGGLYLRPGRSCWGPPRRRSTAAGAEALAPFTVTISALASASCLSGRDRLRHSTLATGCLDNAA